MFLLVSFVESFDEPRISGLNQAIWRHIQKTLIPAYCLGCSNITMTTYCERSPRGLPVTGIPYQMLIATGVLMNLPTDQLESARIDGANPFQTFRHITMPYMLFVTGPALVTDFVKNFNNFNVIYLLTQGVYVTTDQFMAASQAREVDLLVTWLFNLTQNYYNYKMASVIGIMVIYNIVIQTLGGKARTLSAQPGHNLFGEVLSQAHTPEFLAQAPTSELLAMSIFAIHSMTAFFSSTL